MKAFKSFLDKTFKFVTDFDPKETEIEGKKPLNKIDIIFFLLFNYFGERDQ